MVDMGDINFETLSSSMNDMPGIDLGPLQKFMKVMATARTSSFYTKKLEEEYKALNLDESLEGLMAFTGKHLSVNYSRLLNDARKLHSLATSPYF